MRKPAFCICENKDADQLRIKCAADQRLCFRYTDIKIPLLSKSEISSLKPSSVAIQPGLCRTWSEYPKTGFLTTRLNYGCFPLWFRGRDCGADYIVPDHCLPFTFCMLQVQTNALLGAILEYVRYLPLCPS